MLRRFEQPVQEMEFPGRYILDEARFSGSPDHTRNKEENSHAPISPVS